MNKLVLGTVQFGMPYGISNRTGKVELTEAEKVLNKCREAGIAFLDTAAMYGEAEEMLGRLDSVDFNVISKMAPVHDSNVVCYDDIVKDQLEGSLRKTKQRRLYGYLIHHVGDLALHGASLWNALEKVRDLDLVEKIGYSVYSPFELDDVFSRFMPDLIQLPLNVLDREFIRTGWIDKLKDCGVEIHVRSAFLQGLLLLDEEEQNLRFPAYRLIWAAWNEFLSSNNLSPLQACLGFLNSIEGVDRIVVGVANSEELVEIVHQSDSRCQVPDHITTSDTNLIYPYNWTI